MGRLPDRQAAAAILTLILAAPAFGLGAGALQLKAQTEEQVRAQTTELLRTLCPEQCVLLNVEAKVAEQVLSAGTPGFEALEGTAALPQLKGATATVLVDTELPAAFRARLRPVLAQRLKAFGAVEVLVEQAPFPPRTPKDPPASQPVAPAAPDKPEAPPPTLQAQLTSAAPIWAAAALFSVVALLLGALLLVATRKAAPAWDLPPLPAEEAGAGAGAASRVQPPAAHPAPGPADRAAGEGRWSRVEQVLRGQPAIRNAVVRQALARGERALVCAWAHEFGPLVVSDLQHQPALADAVRALATELGERPAPDPRTRDEAVSTLEARLLAARLHPAADAPHALFAFLEGAPEESVQEALRRLSAPALAVALRFVPSEVRTRALAHQPEAVRLELARAWTQRAVIETREAIAAAEELRAGVSSLLATASPDALVMDALEGLDRAAQRRLVQQLAADGGAPRGLLTEDGLVSSPLTVLGAALLALPQPTVLSFLQGTEHEVRERLLSACPGSLRGELLNELSLGAVSSSADFRRARRAVLARVREELAVQAPAAAPVPGPVRPHR